MMKRNQRGHRWEERPNLTYVRTLANNDSAFERNFIASFKNEFLAEVAGYLTHIKQDEPRAAAEFVHELKDKFNILGMQQAYTFAIAHQEKLQLGDKGQDIDFRRLLDKISSFLKTI